LILMLFNNIINHSIIQISYEMSATEIQK